MKSYISLSSLGIALLLAACSSLSGGGNPQPLSSLAPVQTEHPLFKANLINRSAAPLVARYYRVQETEHGGKRHDEAQYWGLEYQPRQSKYQGFEGWDLLETPPNWANPENSRNDWLRIQLNRPAKVVVVWEKSELWLSGWSKGSITLSGKVHNTFSKEFAVGEIALGSPGSRDNPSYFVLLAERGGVPSSEPPMPAIPSLSANDKPLPNQTCPGWLENAWTIKQVYDAVAADGLDYKTWHPQIDPIYWCYYRHDHGSDPALVGYKPAFGYVAKQFNDQSELHVGFKGFAIRDEGANQGWYINVHSETGVQTRACARFHTVVIAVTNLKTGELLSEMGYKGDFGATVSNQNNNPVVNITCPDPKAGTQKTQAQIAAETESSKNLRIFNGTNDPGGYENWHGGGHKALGMSFWGDDKGSNALNIDIRNPGTGCADLNCASIKATGSEADQRTLFVANLKIRYSDTIAQQDRADGKQDGFFWTTLYGDPLPEGKAPGDPGTIRQFIKPNFNSSVGNDGLQGFFTTEDAWRQIYLEDRGVPGVELEDGLLNQN